MFEVSFLSWFSKQFNWTLTKTLQRIELLHHKSIQNVIFARTSDFSSQDKLNVCRYQYIL